MLAAALPLQFQRAEHLSTGAYIPPAPNPFTEQRVRTELAKLDRLLDIRWHPGWTWNERQQRLEGRYLLICYWPPDDRRWRAKDCTHNGETYDILGAFCTNPSDANSVPVDPDSMMDLVIAYLSRCDATRQPHAKRMAEIQQRNRRQHELVKAQIVDDVMEDALRARQDTAFHPPFEHVPVQLESKDNG